MTIPTGLHRILGQDTNLLGGAIVSADNVAPSGAIVPREIERQGSGQALLSGPYTGHQDTAIEIEIESTDIPDPNDQEFAVETIVLGALDLHIVETDGMGNWLLSTDTGTIKTSADDGLTWADGPQLGNGSSFDGGTIQLDPNTGDYVGMDSSLLYRLTGGAWQYLANPPGVGGVFYFEPGFAYYEGGSYGEVNRYTYLDNTTEEVFHPGDYAALGGYNSVTKTPTGKTLWFGSYKAIAEYDGATWSVGAEITDIDGTGIAADSAIVVAVGNHKTTDVPMVATSTDEGATWSIPEALPNAAHKVRDLLHFGGVSARFVAVGDNGMLLQSRDGAAWQLLDSGTIEHLHAVAAGPNTVIAVGEGGTVIRMAMGLSAGTMTTPPTHQGGGNLTMTDLAVSPGAINETITLTLRDTGTSTQAAGIDIPYGRIVAAAAGTGGNTITLTLAPNTLAATPTDYTLVDAWQAGAAEQSGRQWDWGGLPLLEDGTLDPATKRIAFDPAARSVYRQYKRVVGQDWVYVLTPAPVEAIPAGTPVYQVDGGRVLTISDGSTTHEQTEHIQTWYDLLIAIHASTLLDFRGVIAADRYPGGQAVRDADIATTSYIQSITGTGTRYTDTRPDAAAVAGAPTERISVECTAADTPTKERWEIEGSLSGDLGEAVTGQAFTSTALAITIPVRTGQALPSGEISFERTMVARSEGEREPDICMDGHLGPNAADQTIVFVYTQRPPAGCECHSITPAGQLSEDCLGAAVDLDDLIAANLLAGLRTLYAQRAKWVDSNTLIQAPNLIVASRDNDLYFSLMTMFRVSLERIAEHDDAYADWVVLWDEAIIELWRFIGYPGTEVARWNDALSYPINTGRAYTRPTVANENDRWYYVDTARETIATAIEEPTWSTATQSATADGPLVWVCQGLTDIAEEWTAERQWIGRPDTQAMQPALADANGHHFAWTPPATLTTGQDEPEWPTDGTSVVDGDAEWLDIGADVFSVFPPVQQFVWDSDSPVYDGYPVDLNDGRVWDGITLVQPNTPDGHVYTIHANYPYCAARGGYLYYARSVLGASDFIPGGCGPDDINYMICSEHGWTIDTEQRAHACDAGLVSDYVSTWQAGETLAYGDDTIVIRQPVTPNGHYYLLRKTWTTGATPPAWTTTQGQTVVDGDLVWTDQGQIDRAPAWQAGQDYPSTDVAVTVTVRGTDGPSAALVYITTPALALLHAGATEPQWPGTTGDTVADGDLVWTDQGTYGGSGKNADANSDIGGYLSRYQARLDEMEYLNGISEPDTLDNAAYRNRVDDVMGIITAWHEDNTFIVATVDPDLDELGRNADNLYLLRQIAADFLRTLRLIGDNDTAMAQWDTLWQEAQSEINFIASGTPVQGAHKLFGERYRAHLDNLLMGLGIIPDAVNAGIGGQCYYDPGDEYVWRPQGLSRPDAFSNWWYPAMVRKLGGELENLKQWYLAIKVAPSCIGDLKTGDRITVSISVTGGVTATYQPGDKWEIAVVHAAPMQLTGGIDGDDTHTWSVAGSESGPQPDYIAALEDPALYDQGGLQFRLHSGTPPAGIGYRITWDNIGAKWRWRRDGGDWSEPAAVATAPVPIEDGLILAWETGETPSFAALDTYAWDIDQQHAAGHVTLPGADLWRWDGSDADLDLAGGAGTIAAIAIVGILPAGATIDVVGSDDDWATEAWRIVMPTTWPVSIHIPATTIQAAHIKLEIRDGDDGYLRWIYLGTPHKEAQADQISVTRSYAMIAASSGAADGRHAGSSWDASIQWTELLTGPQLDALLALIDEHKTAGDWPIVFIPSLSNPSVAALCRIDADSIELTDRWAWEQGTQGERNISMTLPLKGIPNP